MICYASATTTRRNLHAMLVHNWRLLYSARRMDLWQPGWRYALDNGAWSSFTRSEPWDEVAFREMVETRGAGADWVVAPDVVAGGIDSLRLTERWLPYLLTRCRRVLIAVQDGMVPADVRNLVGDRIGIAIGGSTEWKVEQLGRGIWIDLPCWRHALRVNTARRIGLSAELDSFDGTSPSRFAVTTPKLSAAAAQLDWRNT